MKDGVLLVAAKINVQACLDINISEADMFSLLMKNVVMTSSLEMTFCNFSLCKLIIQ